MDENTLSLVIPCGVTTPYSTMLIYFTKNNEQTLKCVPQVYVFGLGIYVSYNDYLFRIFLFKNILLTNRLKVLLFPNRLVRYDCPLLVFCFPPKWQALYNSNNTKKQYK